MQSFLHDLNYYKFTTGASIKAHLNVLKYGIGKVVPILGTFNVLFF